MNAVRVWVDLIHQLHLAQVAHQAMRDTSVTRQIRDLATVEYARALDAIFARLVEMKLGGVLGRVSAMLSSGGRDERA